MNSSNIAEAFRVLGVHGTNRIPLAKLLAQMTTPLTLREIADQSGINRRHIYNVTERLRDLDIIQPTRPIQPRDWPIIFGPQMLRKKRRDYGVTGPAHYLFNEANLRAAIEARAREASTQILSVLQEATP